ncbi:hypothetical protein BDZ45DRAFT_680161 [Acephala macrosclerotiorum]|nr:hypothetical protein BDZ45DRAFT_680161 [Acephala macrosclerotiorum]
MYAMSSNGNDNSPSSNRSPAFATPSVHFAIPTEQYESKLQTSTPQYHDTFKPDRRLEELQTLPRSPPRILTFFKPAVDSYRPPPNFLPPLPPPSFSTAVLANHIHCPSPPAQKYFPDLRYQYQSDLPIPHQTSNSQKRFHELKGYSPQKKPLSRSEEIGQKLIGVSLADSFLIGPIYAIWSLDIERYLEPRDQGLLRPDYWCRNLFEYEWYDNYPNLALREEMGYA